MRRAMERHATGEAIVIPVILQACDWHRATFGRLLATPTDGKPVTQFADRDQALLEVAKAVREVAGRVVAKRDTSQTATPTEPSAVAPQG